VEVEAEVEAEIMDSRGRVEGDRGKRRERELHLSREAPVLGRESRAAPYGWVWCRLNLGGGEKRVVLM
jgi:hypothetical protein